MPNLTFEQLTFGGYTVADIRQFLNHSESAGESLDSITGDGATSANIIADLLENLEAQEDVVAESSVLLSEARDFLIKSSSALASDSAFPELLENIEGHLCTYGPDSDEG